ncbi:MAG: Crp/Fnr family transcriptional regulator [Pseudorhodoplanes sp.]
MRTLHSLSAEEEAAILGVLGPVQTLPAASNIVSDGDTPANATVILSGLACRNKVLPSGRRQIFAFQHPGDFVDLYGYVLKNMDHSITALTACSVCMVPHAEIGRIGRLFPNLYYALWRDSMVDASVFQTWLLNIGQRSALERLAHLLCEQFYKLAAVGLAELGKPVAVHITQTDLADATGMSQVHVNRTFQELRRRGLIGRDPRVLEILDWSGLKELAGFEPDYLHYKHLHGHVPDQT